MASTLIIAAQRVGAGDAGEGSAASTASRVAAVYDLLLRGVARCGERAASDVRAPSPGCAAPCAALGGGLGPDSAGLRRPLGEDHVLRAVLGGRGEEPPQDRPCDDTLCGAERGRLMRSRVHVF